MTAHDPSKKESTVKLKDYPVGYGKPPKANQFQPGVSGNPNGRPKGRPSSEQILFEEAARLVKVKIGDEVVPISKERGVMRKLLDRGLQGDVAAIRLYMALRYRAELATEIERPLEEPLTADELELFKLMMKRGR